MSIKLNVASSRSRKGKNSYNKSSRNKRSLALNFSWLPRLKSVFFVFSFMIMFCIVLLLLGLGVIQLYKFVITSSYFNTDYINVSGNVRIKDTELLDVLGIKLGENSLAVNIGRVERTILLIPWVEKVSIKRMLPNGFEIKIKERTPFFWVHNGGLLNYSDSHGRIIAPVDSNNFISLPTLRVQPGTEDIFSKLGDYVNDIKLGALPLEFASISSISVDQTKGIELYIEDNQMYLSIAVNDWAGNLKRLSITLNDVIRRNELQGIKEIQSANGNVWVIKKH